MTKWTLLGELLLAEHVLVRTTRSEDTCVRPLALRLDPLLATVAVRLFLASGARVST